MSNLKELYHREIVRCLVRYGHMSEADGEVLLERSGLLANIDEDDILFHESPYFWAMNLIYGTEEPRWFDDRKLWPPSQDYIDLVKRRPS